MTLIQLYNHLKYFVITHINLLKCNEYDIVRGNIMLRMIIWNEPVMATWNEPAMAIWNEPVMAI